MTLDNFTNTGSVYFDDFTSEQKKRIIQGLKIPYGEEVFNITNIGCMPYGFFASIKDQHGNLKGSYCIDFINGGERISIKVRPEGDFSKCFEKILEDFFNKNKDSF